MTGNPFGESICSIPYSNITHVEIHFKFFWGYLEIATGGRPSIDKQILSDEDKKYDPSTKPNSIVIKSKEKLDDYQYARDFILTRVYQSNNSDTIDQFKKSVTDEIREFKELFDDGIITKKEFITKKNELLKK